MSLARTTLQGAGVLALGQGAGQALSFARNLIVARLISVEDFGIAATFAITVSFLEMVSSLAVDRLLVQAEDGDDPRMEGVAHLLQASRGVLLGAALVLLARPLAALFGAPEAAWAFATLGLVPAIRGFLHLDTRRLQRAMRFTPFVAAELSSQILVVLAAFPLARALGDYSVVLWLLVAQSATMVIVSHLVSERPYRWAWDNQTGRRYLAFGWPLLLNGALMFGALQGDRALVGALRGATELGWYSAALTLALMPTMMLAQCATNLLLPLLAKVQSEATEFQRRSELSIESFGLISIAFAMLLIAFGPWLLPFLYGEAYEPAAHLMIWFGVYMGVRLMRITPTIICMAMADTKAALLSNIARTAALPFMAIAIASGAGLTGVVQIGAAGEFVGLMTVFWLVRRNHHLTTRSDITCIVLLLISVSVSVVARPLGPALIAAVAAATGVAAILLLPGVRAEITRRRLELVAAS